MEAPREGWYRLPKSGIPYFGPIPEGVEELSEPAVAEAILDPDNPIEIDPDVVLAGSVEEITTIAADYPIDVVRRLIEAEHAGRDRASLIDKLDRMAKRMEEIPPGT
jgi:hypothetical protein